MSLFWITPLTSIFPCIEVKEMVPLDLSQSSSLSSIAIASEIPTPPIPKLAVDEQCSVKEIVVATI